MSNNNIDEIKTKKKSTCGGGAASSSDESEFPNGMRVLVVDDSMVCLRVISALLHKCHYQVTSKQDSAQALMLLRQNVDNFDIVLTNVHMHEIDGFKMLQAGLELDIPVIMMSASDEKQVIMKGIKHGARDFLLKPLRKEEIKNIWQHVYRKNFLSTPSPANARGEEQDQDPTNKASRVAKRKDIEGVDDKNKLGRVRWTQPLHDLFVGAVQKLGGVDRAVPKKILEEMGYPDITREKVASHLQKYRKALKKQNEFKLQGGQGIMQYSNKINNKTFHRHPMSLVVPPPPPPRPSIGFGGGGGGGNLVGTRMGSGSNTYIGQPSNLGVGECYNNNSRPIQIGHGSSVMMPQPPLQHFGNDGNTYALYDHSTMNIFFDGAFPSLLDGHF